MIKSSLNKESREDSQALGWFRTIIQFDKSEGVRWPDHSQGSALYCQLDHLPRANQAFLFSMGRCIPWVNRLVPFVSSNLTERFVLRWRVCLHPLTDLEDIERTSFKLRHSNAQL